ncbi:MAG: hypothetical protein ACFBSF_04120 [Leptolyngbyaceae cyanobacterium]
MVTMHRVASIFCIGLIGTVGCTPVSEEVTAPAAEITAVSDRQLSLWQAIDSYLTEHGSRSDRFKTAFVDLNQDATLDAVVLTDSCGTGGCTLLVFQGVEDTFQFVSRTTLVREPVLVSDSTTNGWRDLVLEVSGGGITPMTVALLFDGQAYPLNPSLQPPLPVEPSIVGTTLAFEPRFRAIGDAAELESACEQAITSEFSTPATLEFSHTEAGVSAYSYTLTGDMSGLCQVDYDGIVQSLE